MGLSVARSKIDNFTWKDSKWTFHYFMLRSYQLATRLSDRKLQVIHKISVLTLYKFIM